MSLSDAINLSDEANLDLVVPSKSTARIQEMHILAGHILCDLIEKRMKL